MEFERRSFLFQLSALVMAPPAWLKITLPHRTGHADQAVFSQEQLATFGALANQIYPKDDTPGALDLGAPQFLAQTLIKAHPDWLAIYREGLNSTDLSCHTLHKQSLTDLPFQEQTVFVQQMDKSALPQAEWKAIAGKDFFIMVRDHTLQAVFSHPRYGGNKEKAAWKTIGYDDWWA